MPQDDPAYVERMVSFFYRGTYEALDEHRYVNHAGVFALAVKHNIPGLQELACAEYWRVCQKEWDVFGFLDSVPGIYQDTRETVRELRGYAQKCARVHMNDLVGEETSRARWRHICLTVPEFAFDMLTSFTRIPMLGRCHSCGPNQELESLQCRCKCCGKGGAQHM